MPILNYTTIIDSHKTVGEIQSILARSGAMAVSVDYQNGQPSALLFLLDVKGTPVSFRLPSRWQGVYAAICNDSKVPRNFKNEAQAQRVSWRIIKDWVEAQMAIIEAGLAMPAEVFLPYAVTASGKTVYQVFEDDQKLLGTGK